MRSSLRGSTSRISVLLSAAGALSPIWEGQKMVAQGNLSLPRTRIAASLFRTRLLLEATAPLVLQRQPICDGGVRHLEARYWHRHRETAASYGWHRLRALRSLTATI